MKTALDSLRGAGDGERRCMIVNADVAAPEEQ
jgi:hypothetical protein